MPMNRSRQDLCNTDVRVMEKRIEGREKCDGLNKRGSFTTRRC